MDENDCDGAGRKWREAVRGEVRNGEGGSHQQASELRTVHLQLDSKNKLPCTSLCSLAPSSARNLKAGEVPILVRSASLHDSHVLV